MTTACIPLPLVPQAPWAEWTLNDVRWLASPEDNPTWIAAYFRKSNSSCQFRFDVLDYSNIEEKDLVLYLSSRRTEEIEYIINIPFSSSVQGFSLSHNQNDIGGVQVFRNPSLDSLLIQINNPALCTPSHRLFSISLQKNGSTISSTPLISIDSTPPRPARIMFTFWDCLPASTPLQLMRRWDGAHTGPFGQRHGLKVLLEASEIYDIPIFLLDLRKPESLAGLDFMGQIGWIDYLQNKRTIILPDVAWGSPLTESLSRDLVNEVSQNYGLKSSDFFYIINGEQNKDYSFSFQFQDNPSQVFQNGNLHILPLPYSPMANPPEWISKAANQDGLSPDVLLKLLGTSLDEPEKFLVLGGSIPSSPLADKAIAEPLMQYIDTHPWIIPVSQYDLQTFSTLKQLSEIEHARSTPSNLEIQIINALLDLPENDFSLTAIEFFSNLTNDYPSQSINKVTKSYLGQVQNLIYASTWADSPSSNSNCDIDMDGDKFNECILSNQNYLIIADSLGGRIELAAYCDQKENCFQFIGSTAQLSIGLSDPSSWNTAHLYNPDPLIIPGALAEPGNPEEIYQTKTTRESITLISSDGITKTIQLKDGKLSLILSSPHSFNYSIPIIFDLASRYLPGWDAQQTIRQIGENSFSLQSIKSPNLTVKISGSSFHISSYKETLPYFNEPENPDRTIKDVFLQPFSLYILDIDPSMNWSIEFSPR